MIRHDISLLSIQLRYQNWKQIALKSILVEAASFPALGLVSRVDNGCHSDMDYQLFCRSQMTFDYYFTNIIALVALKRTADWAQLRAIGIQQERRMLQATNGVNTHKGLIFSFGIIFYQLVHADYYQLPISNWPDHIHQFCQPLATDFAGFKQRTAGEYCYQSYQVKGARGQALAGYSIVFQNGLQFLQQVMIKEPNLTDENHALLLLIFYLSQIDDTTLIAKVGYHLHKTVQVTAQHWIAQFHQSGWNQFQQIVLAHNEVWKQARISPGGCADLVVLTLFLSKIMVIS